MSITLSTAITALNARLHRRQARAQARRAARQDARLRSDALLRQRLRDEEHTVTHHPREGVRMEVALHPVAVGAATRLSPGQQALMLAGLAEGLTERREERAFGQVDPIAELAANLYGTTGAALVHELSTLLNSQPINPHVPGPRSAL